MEKKFETLVNSYILGNLSIFRKDLNKLSKKNLILFLHYCHQFDFEIDIFIVEKFLD